MKMPWLLLMLATLGAFVPEAFAAIEEPRLQPGSGLRRRKCPGCYTHLEQAPPSEDFGRAELSLRPSPSLSSLMELLRPYEERLGAEPALEDSAPIPSLQTKRRRARSACPSCFEPLDTPKAATRSRREERKVASGRRRGKRPGTRPVCRGCFSGLMLTGRPAQGVAQQGALPKSLSESGEDSSGGD